MWHAATVGSAAQFFHHGIVFDAGDMARFVKTQREVCWNGDADAPAFRLVNGMKAAEGERILAPALAPFDDAIAGFLYTGKRQEERLAKADSPWHGGVLAAEWLRGKYVELPRAKGGRAIHGDLARASLAREENQRLLGALHYPVGTPGWLTPPTPSQVPPGFGPRPLSP